MPNLKKNVPRKTPILPLSFATNAISLVPRIWDISRFVSVMGLYDHPVMGLYIYLKRERERELVRGNGGKNRLLWRLKFGCVGH
jgi:hypothetical protein